MGFLLSALGVNYNLPHLTTWGGKEQCAFSHILHSKGKDREPWDPVPVRSPLAESSQHCSSAGFLGDRCDLGEAIGVGAIHDFAFIISYLKVEVFKERAGQMAEQGRLCTTLAAGGPGQFPAPTLGGPQLP